MPRKRIPQTVETDVLTKSRRRCAICFGLKQDTKIKDGQIAHLDQNNENANFENLAFLCLEHHNQYDGRTRQSKGLTEKEVKFYRDDLYQFAASEQGLSWPDYPETGKSKKTIKRKTLSLDVYDRRIQMYRIIRDFLSLVTSSATVTLNELSKFAQDTDEALFMFDKELAEYIREMYINAIKLRFSHERLEGARTLTEEERTALINMNTELLIWFGNQYENAREKFSKYIALA